MGYQPPRTTIPEHLLLLLLPAVVVREGVAEVSTTGFLPTLVEVAAEDETVVERVRKVVNLAQSPLKSVLAPSLFFSAEPVVPELQEA